MSTYENAPATKLLATHCACCGRPLVDARSVEYGIGPDCAKKYDFARPCCEEARLEANQLIYLAAAKQKGIDVYQAAERLEALGFAKVAERLIERSKVTFSVEISTVTLNGYSFFKVAAPYSAEATESFRKIHGRFFQKVDGKPYNFVPSSAKTSLYALLHAHYSGHFAKGPAGAFAL